MKETEKPIAHNLNKAFRARVWANFLEKPLVHNLNNGATVISLSPHGFRFSDGTESKPQIKGFCDLFNLERRLEKVKEIKGMKVNKVSLVFCENQLEKLKEIADSCDIVILPFPALTALREMGVRDQFTNCVAFNATKETMRSAPQDKVVDINNWSY